MGYTDGDIQVTRVLVGLASAERGRERSGHICSPSMEWRGVSELEVSDRDQLLLLKSDSE